MLRQWTIVRSDSIHVKVRLLYEADEIINETYANGDILQKFIATFSHLDDLIWLEDDPVPELLAQERDPDDGMAVWRPAKLETADSALDAIRRIGPLPTLYESLALTFRWYDVDLGVCQLLGNPPATDLRPLADSIYSDPVMNTTLLPARFVRFALAPNGCYDPFCFDLSRMVDGDCPIVKMNHESILMNDTIGEVTTIFGSFRELVNVVIESVG